MIAMESHVFKYYLIQSEGNTSKAALMCGINRYKFVRSLKMCEIDYKKFRKPMCYCRKLKGERCEVCIVRNRAAAAVIYQRRKLRMYVPKSAPAKYEGRDNVARTLQMLALSDRMQAIQRLLRLSK
jgi:hypothetical protein